MKVEQNNLTVKNTPLASSIHKVVVYFLPCLIFIQAQELYSKLPRLVLFFLCIPEHACYCPNAAPCYKKRSESDEYPRYINTDNKGHKKAQCIDLLFSKAEARSRAHQSIHIETWPSEKHKNTVEYSALSNAFMNHNTMAHWFLAMFLITIPLLAPLGKLNSMHKV